MYSSTCSGANSYFMSTQHDNLHQPYNDQGDPLKKKKKCRPTQDPVLATVNTGKTWGEVLKKNEGEWTGKVEIKKSLAVDEAYTTVV